MLKFPTGPAPEARSAKRPTPVARIRSLSPQERAGVRAAPLAQPQGPHPHPLPEGEGTRKTPLLGGEGSAGSTPRLLGELLGLLDLPPALAAEGLQEGDQV